MTSPGDPLRVLGAGVSGLVAAIVLARAGRRVQVFERRGDSGTRFAGDFQGIESWSTPGDVLDEIAGWGIDPATFRATPFRSVSLATSRGGRTTIEGPRSGFWLVRRGVGAGTLDQGLKAQALREGVELRYGETLPEADCHVVATGPRRASGLVRGELFRLDGGEDRVWIRFSRELAPGGYTYLIVSEGVGLVATVLMRREERSERFLDETLRWYVGQLPELAGRRPLHRFGGIGYCALPRRVEVGGRLYVGEAAGFQDALWGFGIRYAMTSGHLAARALVEGGSYARAVRRRLRPLQVKSVLNRLVFDLLGDRAPDVVAGAWLLRQRLDGDGLRFVERLYRPSWLSRLLGPLAGAALLRQQPSAGALAHRYLPMSGGAAGST